MFEATSRVFEPFGRKAGLSGTDLASVWMPQIVASVVQIPINYFFTDLGSRIVNGILGLATGIPVVFGWARGNTALELSEMSSYWLTSLYVPYPQNGFVSQWQSFISGIKSGSSSTIQSSIMASSSYQQTMVSNFQSLFGGQSTTTAAKPAAPKAQYFPRMPATDVLSKIQV